MRGHRGRVCIVLAVFLLAMGVGAAENLALNNSFESGLGTLVNDWSLYGECGRETWAAQHNYYGVGFYGWQSTYGYFYQDRPCEPNTKYYFRILTRYEVNYADRVMRQYLSFYDSATNFITRYTNAFDTALLNNNQWYTNVLEGVSPPNAAVVRMRLYAPGKTPLAGPSSRGAFADNVKLLGHTNSYRTGEIVEEFIYDEISNHALDGGSWGHGFTSTWQVSHSDSFVMADWSLGDTMYGYPDNRGIKTLVTPPSAQQRWARRGIPAVSTGKIYVAAMMNYQYDGDGKWCGLSMMQGTNELLFAGEVQAADERLGLTTFPGGSNKVSSFRMYPGYGNDYLVIGKYDYSTRRFQASCYYQGSAGAVPASEPAVWDATAELTPGQIGRIDGVQLNAGATNGTPGNCYFDEVRVATNWWDLLDIDPQDPSQPASALAVSNIQETCADIHWTRGNGENCLVVCRAGFAPVDPADGTSYTADARMGMGDSPGSGSYVIYKGEGSHVLLTNLVVDTTYYVSVFEYNGSGALMNYGSTNELQDSFSTATAEIEVRHDDVLIVDGDMSPSGTDHTDFGLVDAGQAQTQRFWICNTGGNDLALTGTPRVACSGDSAFTVIAQPPATVASLASNYFDVQFLPQAGGAQTSQVSIASNDSDENPYEFALAGEGMVPLVTVGGTNLSFSSQRGVLPSLQTFVITNAGNGTLGYTNYVTCSGGASDWLVVTPSAGTLAAGASRMHTCRIDTVSFPDAGTHSGSCAVRGGLGGTQEVVASWQLSAATLTVTADDAARVYGAANPTIGVSYSGFLSGENEGDIQVQPTAACAATATSAVGSYATVASGGVDANYAFQYANGTMTITAKVLDVTADDAVRDYGATNPSFTLQYSGWANGDNSGDLTEQPVALCSATPSSPTGTYAIVVSGGSDDNYWFERNDGVLTITNGIGTCRHVPQEIALVGETMRWPSTNGVSYMQPVSIYNANPVADGTQTNAILVYRREGAVWFTSVLTNEGEQAGTAYWQTAIQPGLFGDNELIEYYIMVQYQYNLPTYIGTTNEGVSSVAYRLESSARNNAFTFRYAHNQAPVFTMNPSYTVAVGSSTGITVDVTDPDGGSVTVTNIQPLAGSGFDGTTFSWTAGASDCHTTGQVLFVADDGRELTNSVVTNGFVVVVPWDSDTDDMADGWEWDAFATLARDGTGDADGDGATDYTEFVAGTGPNSGDSVFRVERPAVGTTDDYEITINTEPGRQYTIEFRDGPADPLGWQPFASPAHGVWIETNTVAATYTFSDDFGAQTSGHPPADGQRLYRVRVEQP